MEVEGDTVVDISSLLDDFRRVKTIRRDIGSLLSSRDTGYRERKHELQTQLLSCIVRLREDFKKHLIDPGSESALHDAFRDGDPIYYLWKYCFYSQIDQFRASESNAVNEVEGLNIRIRKLKADKKVLKVIPGTVKLLSKGSPLTAIEGVNSHLDDEVSTLVKKRSKMQAQAINLVREMMKVLAEAHDYFVDLYNALKLTLDYSSKKSIATCGDKNISILIYRLHRCLICLGDIERYTITYSDTPPPKTKDFLPSEKYYERAAFILPASGVPHNQLATVARLQTNQNINQRHDFNIMYRFCRSILCGAPCSAGKVNLEKQYGIMISDIASFN